MSNREDSLDSTLKTITIELGQKMSQKVSLCEHVCIETFLGLQKQHENFVSQQEARKKIAKIDRLDDLMYDKIKVIPGGTMKLKEIAKPQEAQRPSIGLEQEN